jgi:glycogen(starch) synthase
MYNVTVKKSAKRQNVRKARPAPTRHRKPTPYTPPKSPVPKKPFPSAPPSAHPAEIKSDSLFISHPSDPATTDGNAGSATEDLWRLREAAARAAAPASIADDTPVGDLPLLFEIAWEVCWQLGGIYTVLKTKAACMAQRWDDRYFLIGPYNPSTAVLEFEELTSEGLIHDTLHRLRQTGTPCHFGRWLVPGNPRVILLDYRARFDRLGDDKFLLWTDHGIATHSSDGEVNECVAFGFAVADFFRTLTELAPGRTILAHFHEWMGGVAVPRIAHMRLPIATVFTTHATLLGRYLAADRPDFYQALPHLDGEAEAAKYNVQPRHHIEKAAAHAATVFTTVSEVTAAEAQQLLQRRPDVILPNGLNIERFAALHEFQNLHSQYKEHLHEFVMGHFFPTYTFDLDRTLYLFTSGRYEYRNKGLDLFIEALWRLNQLLKREPDAPTVVAFIITNASVRNINVNVLQRHMQLSDLRTLSEMMEREMGRSVFQAAAAGRLIGMKELLPDDAVINLKRAIHASRSSQQPGIVTHDLSDDAHDPVLRHLRHRQLFNAADDPVKIVFHPQFVTVTSPLIALDYEQFVRGCHLGIFPSYYEPWGYTPMECVALGVPAVTSDLSGFGAYVQRSIPRHDEQGIVLIDRRSRGFDEAADDLALRLLSFTRLDRRQRVELRNKVERLSELFDWERLIAHYHDAHDMALQRTNGKRPGRLEVRVV